MQGKANPVGLLQRRAKRKAQANARSKRMLDRMNETLLGPQHEEALRMHAERNNAKDRKS